MHPRRPVSLPPLQEVSLEISAIKTACYMWRIKRRSIYAGYTVVSGVYREGSAGAQDATYIHWRLNEFCDLTHPALIQGLVVDFTNLEYTYGDDLEITPDRIVRMRLPLRIVVPADKRDRFEPVLGSEHLSTSLEDAFGYVQRSLEQG